MMLSSSGCILSTRRPENSAITLSMAARFLIVPKTRSVARWVSLVWWSKSLKMAAAYPRFGSKRFKRAVAISRAVFWLWPVILLLYLDKAVTSLGMVTINKIPEVHKVRASRLDFCNLQGIPAADYIEAFIEDSGGRVSWI